MCSNNNIQTPCLWSTTQGPVNCQHDELEFTPGSPRLAQMLHELLRNPSMAVRRLALRQLGRLGRLAERFAPALVETLFDGTELVRKAACQAVDAILADCLNQRRCNQGV
jgi:hypothetical protein